MTFISLPLKGFIVMYDLNEKDLLFETSKYCLDREDGRMEIDVLKLIAGDASHGFIAVPSLFIGFAEKAFWGTGDTGNEALRECLSRIKNVDVKTIFPSLKDVKEGL